MSKQNKRSKRPILADTEKTTIVNSDGGDIAIGGSVIDKRKGRVFIETSPENSPSRVRPTKPINHKGSANIFVIVPRAIGRFVLDIFGRDKATNLTAIILGYVFIIVTCAVMLGIINLSTLGDWFRYNWRFFFPAK